MRAIYLLPRVTVCLLPQEIVGITVRARQSLAPIPRHRLLPLAV